MNVLRRLYNLCSHRWGSGLTWHPRRAVSATTTKNGYRVRPICPSNEHPKTCGTLVAEVLLVDVRVQVVWHYTPPPRMEACPCFERMRNEERYFYEGGWDDWNVNRNLHEDAGDSGFVSFPGLRSYPLLPGVVLASRPTFPSCRLECPVDILFQSSSTLSRLTVRRLCSLYLF